MATAANNAPSATGRATQAGGRRPLLFISGVAAASAGLAVGWFLGGKRSTGFPSLRTSEQTARAGAAYLPRVGTAPLGMMEILARLQRECDRQIWRRTKEWEVAFNALDGLELASLVAGAHGLVLAPEQVELREALLSRWGECDPAAAMAFAGGISGAALREAGLAAVLDGWLYSSPDEAVPWIERMPDGAVRNRAIARALHFIAPKNPVAALQLAASLPAAQQGVACASVFGVWAAAAPQAAAAHLEAANLPPQQRSSALEAIVRAWAGRDAREAIAWLEALPDGREKKVLHAIVLGIWVSCAPQAATTYGLSLPAGPRRTAAMAAIAGNWPPHDFEGVRAWLQDLPDAALRRHATHAFVTHLGRTDPDAAVRFVEKLPASAGSSSLLRDVLNTWAGSDPAAAFGYVERMPAGELRSSILAEAGGAWASIEPMRALTAAQALPSGDARIATLSRIIGQVAQHDPEAALEYLRSSTSGAERTALLLAIATSMATEDPELAAMFAAALPPGGIHASAIMHVVNGLMQQNPQSALQWAQSLPEGSAKTAALEQVAESMAAWDPHAAVELAVSLRGGDDNHVVHNIVGIWAPSDPTAALAWVQRELPEGHAKNRAIIAAGAHLAVQDPARALALASESLMGPPQQMLFHQIGQHWGQIDPAAAIARIRETAPAGARAAFINGIVESITTRSPWEAANLLVQLPAADVQMETVELLAARWSSVDPAAASAWISNFSPGPLRDSAVNKLMHNWAAAEPAAAGQWLNALPPGGSRDRAFHTYTERLAAHSPSQAAAWISAIVDPGLRQTAIATVTSQWAKIDRTAAAAWLETTGLSDGERRALLGERPGG